ncbi:MAG TPA: S9 family peptidase [Usitatibacter sp.]|jgi:dipeptidyl aminopeptidase/acylaminoacyl peptidase|nr:S9 family peptidase [Usitatibacter sp.]
MKRIDVDLLWRIERPAQPTLSPDGAMACVSVTAYDMQENKGTSSLWLLSAFGGEPRQLTTAGEKDAEPRWSPDGRWIAFVAKRAGAAGEKPDEEAQIWLIAPDGGEARRLTDIATGAFGAKWFPDSRRIAFISWVWPEEKGLKAIARRYKAWKDDKVKAHVVEHSAYRWWDKWLSDGRVPRLFSVDVDTGAVRDLFAGTKYELARADPTAHLYDIAPDGREIVFSYDPADDKRFDHSYQLVAMDVRRKRFRVLTRGSPLNHETPRYSPDGRWIALVTQDLRRSFVDTQRVALVDRRNGRMTIATKRWDRSAVPPLLWNGDSTALYFVAEENARQHLFRYEIGSREPVIAASGGVVSDFDVAGDAIAFVRNDMSTPPQVLWSAPGERARRIDRLNDAIMDGVKLGEVRERTIEGWNREKVQMWVIYPPDFDPKKKWPLLHNIHGGPHSAWGDNFHFRWNNHAFAAQGYVVVCVNYHGSSSFGQRFLESIDREWGKRELADMEAGTNAMLRESYIDRDRLVAAGGSYGGYMVAWMNGHTDRYKAYVCHAGCFDWVGMFADDAWYWHPKELGAFYWDNPKRVAAQNPLTFARRMKTPTLVIHGLLDYRVPDSQGLAYYNTLKAKGVDSRLVFFPDENHWILKPQNSRLWYREFFAWLGRYVETGGKARGARAPRPGSRTRGR